MPCDDTLDGGAGVDTASFTGSAEAVRVTRDNTLVPNGAEFRVNARTENGQQDPSVTGLSYGGFVVTWQSLGQGGSGSGVYGQRYSLPEGSGGDAEGDVLRNIENLIGSDHDDHLTGDGGDNHLDGGVGADTFVFASFEGDRITDFEDGEDRIEIVGGANAASSRSARSAGLPAPTYRSAALSFRTTPAAKISPAVSVTTMSIFP